MVSEIRFRICQPVNLKGNKPWILIGRTDAEAEAPVFWSPDVNSQLNGKVPGTFSWERLRAEGKEGIRGWDGWMASSIQWMWTWANFRRWWGAERPSVLQTEQQQNVYYLAHHPLEPQTQSSIYLFDICVFVMQTQLFKPKFNLLYLSRSPTFPEF